MKTRISTVYIVPLVVSILSLAVSASETSAQQLHGTLGHTYTNEDSTSLILNSIGAYDVVAPLTLNCTGKKSCYANLTLSIQVSSLSPADPNVVVLGVYVDEALQNVGPTNPTGIDSVSTGSASNVRTVQWVATGLAPGKHTIRILGFVETGTAGSASRILKADVVQQ